MFLISTLLVFVKQDYSLMLLFYFVYKTLFLVSYSQKFFECGPDLLFNIQTEIEMQ